MNNNSQPGSEQAANEEAQTTPAKWGLTWLIMVSVIVGAGIALVIAVPFINAALITDDDVRSAVRTLMLSAQEEMAGPPNAPNETFTSPFPTNPHRTDEGVMIALCFGPENTSYTMTAWGIEGEYWNASHDAVGAIRGPEAVPACVP